MGEIRWNVDDMQYDDRHSHTLILNGWFLDPENKEYDFRLFGDGEPAAALPAPRRFDRPDVTRQFPELSGKRNAGFTVQIPEVDALCGQYRELELCLVCGEERQPIWKETTSVIRDFCRDRLMEYHMDREDILYKTSLAIEGWVLNQRGEETITVEDGRGNPVKCQLSRYRRPDVMESRELDADFRDREIGFRISLNLEDVRGKTVALRFRSEELEKLHVIDIKKLMAQTYPRRWGKKAARDDYEQWLENHSPTWRERRRQRRTVFTQAPLISIVIPLYNTPVPYLEELLRSVKKQTYANWQLCLADGSEGEELREFLRKKYRREKRISYKKLQKNTGISGNTNAALEMAVGDYIMLCDHDDVLAPDALYEIVKAIQDQKADVVYTDEDKISMDGRHYFEPNFKPDFNLFRFRENNYICHIFVVKRFLLQEAGMFRREFDGAQDFDLIFRCCERAEKIVHIPKVLYHWRCHMASTAADPASKAYAYEAGRKAVEEHYKRLGTEAEVELTDRPGWYRSHVKIQGNPLVSIIIPNKDHIRDLELCLTSIHEKSTYFNYEVLIVENNSQEPETFVYYEQLPARFPQTRVLTWEKAFNYAAINNFAAEQAAGDYLLFLNNDVEIITPGWMEEMLQICQQSGVGIVGAKLYYPDDTIQHAGVVLGLGGIAGHIMCRALRSDTGYMGRMVSVQEISAVTAACMLMKTSVFREVEGFDEAFEVAFNDIDLCMKAWDAGKKVVFTPYAELYHYESKSRGMEDTPEKQIRFAKEVRRFQNKWARELQKGDPFYSPNLSVTEGDCSLRNEERNED